MRKYLSTLPAAVILFAVLSHGLSEKIHARLLGAGESSWPGYHLLRVDPAPPECRLLKAAAGTESDELDDLLDGGDSEPPPGDLLDDLLGSGEEASGSHQDAVAAANRQCEERRAQYQRTLAELTPAVVAFRALETTFAAWTQWTTSQLPGFLLVLLLIGAATATWSGSHIALRLPATTKESRVRALGELCAHALLLNSSLALWEVEQSSGVVIRSPELHAYRIVGFLVIALLAAWRLARPPSGLPAGGSLLRGLLTVPLYATMAQIAGLYFLLVEGHGAGLAIQLGRLSEHALMYIDVGLYVWAGMLLKQSRISDLVLDMGRPWRLSPEPFALAIVAIAALPTAYSGASGIFVIAAGGLLYKKLREAGSRQGLALAATAMAGSTGVVLRPCLLVVIVASLNKQVTTTDLYTAGRGVFFLTLAVLAAVLWVGRGQPWQIARPRQALPESLRQAKPLLPYAAVFVGCVVLFRLALDARLDEHSAPFLLPVILILLLCYDRRSALRAAPVDGGPAPLGLVGAAAGATRETVGHVGALLTLMGLSVALGGVVERAELMSFVPDQFASPWLAMAVFVVVLVVVGMAMDPYGAVILVSATLPRVALGSGIDPVHFWMVVLVAFELGYLTPPVALNHLLTRQVVEEELEPELEAPVGGFWRRHERLLLPMTVLGVVLLVVAFGPLVFRFT